MKPLFLILVLLLFSSCVRTQTISGDNAEFTFSQAWVWQYKNELLAQNELGHQGEMVVYFNPETQNWMFNAESFGVSGEMFQWIIGKPNGEYLICYVDEFGKTNIYKETIEFSQNKIIPAHYQFVQNQMVFNDKPDLGFEKIIGQEYQIKYEKMEGKSIYYLSEFQADFSALYHFNQLNCEAKLPFWFPVDLPRNQLILEMKSLNGQGKMISNAEFQYISQTEYYIKTDEKN